MYFEILYLDVICAHNNIELEKLHVTSKLDYGRIQRRALMQKITIQQIQDESKCLAWKDAKYSLQNEEASVFEIWERVAENRQGLMAYVIKRKGTFIICD